jgi:ubiquinone/menaquinone biosynthesis C-methylase UbiE
MAINKDIIRYWEQSTPMSFIPEKLSYEEKRNFRYSLQDYMHEVFEFDKYKGMQILEIGCGSGVDTAEFARHGAIVTSTDLTEKSVELTRDLLKEIGLSAKVIQADATKLPFEDESFDCVYSYGVLHHIPEMETALAEIHRVLKPGGKLMVMLYHRDSLLYAYSIIYWRGIKEGMLKKLSQDELVSRYSERNEGCPYTRVFTRAEAKKAFSPWFKDIQTTVRYNVIDTPNQRKVKISIPEEYELGWHLIVKGTRK